MRKSVFLLITSLVLFPVALWSQQTSSAILEFFDDDTQISVTDADGFPVSDLYYGYELSAGSTVKTAACYAELRLDPNGTIIKLAPETEFRVEGVQGSGGAESNDFSLFTGKIRAIAASLTGSKYRVRTPTAVCGVRGTDFGMEVIPGQRDAVFLLEGQVEFMRNSGESILVSAGEFADALSETFSASLLAEQQLSALFQDLQFTALDPALVPGKSPESAESEKAEEESDGEEEQTDENDGGDEEEVSSEEKASETVTEVTDAAVAAPPESEAAGEADEQEKSFLDGLFRSLGEGLGIEMGAVTIQGETFSKLVFSPVFSIGKLKAGLYLPIIYTNDIFASESWYRPGGNDEWSFGTDKDELQLQVSDFFADLALKIRFIEWGQQRDPFYLKVGNLSSMTLGHGSIVRNFANDSDFPAVRRVGVNLGLDREKSGFELLVNDLSEPEIFGARFYARPAAPAFPIAFALTAVSDIDPAGSLPEDSLSAAYRETDPLFFNVGLDLDFPIVETEPLSIIIFSDVAAFIPYLRSAYAPGGEILIRPGFAIDAVYSGEEESPEIRNYGLVSGFFGNILMVDYRFDFRLFDGIFKPAFYSRQYDRVRGAYVGEVIDYLVNTDAPEYQRTLMGIYGEAAFSLFDLLRMEAGYLWPWAFDPAGKVLPSDEDFLHLSLVLERDALSFVDLSASISYDRSRFVPALIDGEAKNLSLFDENTVLKGELVYGIAPGLDLAALYSTTVVMEDGELVYDENGKQKLSPSFSLETRVNF